ncbi:hypothetical protein NE236_18800 [Actinoallomurus purpureus]|uniref:DUF2510 domain-containing protein n=1 Tax=Actinoallomurus purpureus TaxID=478114 RepID=UPI0020927DB0|nr:hypothetical protein [Actinoallomurus purpureus]MCO6007035.1 hypothetical protein [Actinoallomurus purpureus]
MTPAGWYRDPYGDPGLVRWWDGYQWTQATQPLGEGHQPAGDQSDAPPAWAQPGPGPGPGQPTTQTWAPPGPVDPARQTPADPGQAQPTAPAGEEADQAGPAPTWGEAGPAAPTGEPGRTGPTQAWGDPGQAGPAWGDPGQAGAAWADPGQAGAAWGTPGQAGTAWGAPGQAGPGAPTWAGPGAVTPPGRTRSRLPLLIGGGAAIVIIITVVAILLATNVFGGGNGGRSPVIATTTDTQAGISYPRLGGSWRTEAVTATSGLGKLGFDQGEVATVMTDFQNGQPYVASAYSGVGTDTTSVPLEVKAKAVLAALEPTAYPAHTRQDLTSESHPVDGHTGWLVKVKLTFPQAKSQGWNFRTETAALVIIDRGNGQAPAQFYVSIPDSHKHQGDLDLLLTSLKVS